MSVVTVKSRSNTYIPLSCIEFALREFNIDSIWERQRGGEGYHENQSKNKVHTTTRELLYFESV